MPNSFFQFKRFTVHHDLCAMKVGTDGVLLGAWTNCKNAQSILDIGTGSGLISLMLAQRSNASVYGIDIDKGAFEQAIFNVKHSPFHNRIEIIQSSLQHFNPGKTFDLIVSNPPYFINSLKSPGEERSQARHNDELPLEILLEKSASLLATQGKIALILPFDLLETADKIARILSLTKIRETRVKTTPEKSPKRVLLEYTKEQSSELHKNTLCIELSRHQYSSEFAALMKDFYLK